MTVRGILCRKPLPVTFRLNLNYQLLNSKNHRNYKCPLKSNVEDQTFNIDRPTTMRG
jgi:hypothetical protein